MSHDVYAVILSIVVLLQAIRVANELLTSLYATKPSVVGDIWAAIDENIQINECKLLVYNPENPDLHPYSGALWNFIFIFYNAKLNRLIIFGCSAWSNASPRMTFEIDIEEDYPHS